MFTDLDNPINNVFINYGTNQNNQFRIQNQQLRNRYDPIHNSRHTQRHTGQSQRFTPSPYQLQQPSAPINTASNNRYQDRLQATYPTMTYDLFSNDSRNNPNRYRNNSSHRRGSYHNQRGRNHYNNNSRRNNNNYHNNRFNNKNNNASFNNSNDNSHHHSSSNRSNYDADLEFAKRLQEQFDKESIQSDPTNNSVPKTQPNHPPISKIKTNHRYLLKDGQFNSPRRKRSDKEEMDTDSGYTDDHSNGKRQRIIAPRSTQSNQSHPPKTSSRHRLDEINKYKKQIKEYELLEKDLQSKYDRISMNKLQEISEYKACLLNKMDGLNGVSDGLRWYPMIHYSPSTKRYRPDVRRFEGKEYLAYREKLNVHIYMTGSLDMNSNNMNGSLDMGPSASVEMPPPLEAYVPSLNTDHTDPNTKKKKKKKKKKLYPCPTCKQLFASKYGVGVHSRIHAGLLPYKCPTCFKGLRTLQQWQRHARTCKKRMKRKNQIKS